MTNAYILGHAPRLRAIDDTHIEFHPPTLNSEEIPRILGAAVPNAHVSDDAPSVVVTASQDWSSPSKITSSVTEFLDINFVSLAVHSVTLALSTTTPKMPTTPTKSLKLREAGEIGKRQGKSREVAAGGPGGPDVLVESKQ